MTRPERGHLGELVRLFGRLGFVAFGGPAVHIAMMHDEVVTRRGWLRDEAFVDLVGATNLIPGPNSTEMAMHVGHRRAGWRGLVVAGVSFIVPAAAIVLVLAWVYVRYGATSSGEALLYGVKPVVVAIVVQALAKLIRTVVRGPFLGAVGLAAVGAYLAGANEIAVLGAGALVVFTVRWSTGQLRRGRTLAAWPWPLLLAGPVSSAAVAAAGGSHSVGLAQLFAVFAKAGAFLYGSGYVLLAFLRSDLVAGLGVLTNQQLLDAVAVGQFTPGPVFTTATFIGYVLAGFPGAAVATVAIFLPSFFFVAGLTRLLPRLRRREATGWFLDGVNVAALGLMAGVLTQLAGDALVDPLTVSLAAAGVVLWRTSLNSSWLVAAGAAVGLLAQLP